MIEAVRQLIAIPSITSAPAEEGMPFGKPVHDALLHVLKLCDSFGFRTKNCGDYLGWAEIGEGEEMMGILCHLDVVPTGSDWVHDPFAGEIEDGKLYGRGVVDDKGPAVTAIYAMKDILDSGKPLKCRVRIIFGCQEEDGDWTDMQYYKEHEEIPTFGFTPDADFPTIYGEKGIVMVNMSVPAEGSGFVLVKGGEAPNMVADRAEAVLADGTVLCEKGKSAHGSTPEEGVNAITKLMEKATECGAPFAKFYMEKIGWNLDGSAFGIGFSDEASGKLTFNVGKIYVDEGMINTEIDIRYPVTYSSEAVLNGMKNTAGDKAKFSIITEMAPVYMDKNGPVITKLMEAYKEITGDDTQPQVMGGGTYARAVENIVAFGPLFPGRECTEHQKDEYIYVEDLKKAREIYRLAIDKLACK